MTITDQFIASLASFSPEFGLTLSPEQVTQCGRHYELLLKWNRHCNLTRITAPAEAARWHFCESLFAARFLAVSAGIADLGSGAGFPGIPLAIVLPQLPIKLVEINQKKVFFLREAIRSLGLTNTEVLAARFQAVDLGGLTCVVRAIEQFQTNLGGLFASAGVRQILLFAGEKIGRELENYQSWEIEAVPIPLAKNRWLFCARRRCST